MTIQNVISITEHVLFADESLRKMDAVAMRNLVRCQVIWVNVRRWESGRFHSSLSEPLWRRRKEWRRFKEGDVCMWYVVRSEVLDDV